MAKATRADELAVQLRADILGGRLRPGEQLKFQPLVERLNASIAVLREALSKLVDSGLVEVVAHQGYRVKSLSYAELHDLTTARIQVEVAVFIDSVRNGTLEWESEVVAAHHVLDQTPLYDALDPSRLSDEWSQAHERFHRALLSRGQNQRLSVFAARLREEAELYRRWSVSLPAQKQRDVPHEHRVLLELAIARRADEAGTALAAHIERTTELVLATSGDSRAAPVGRSREP
ncbi:GntR family transcriptional regulator [Herbiconiux liukaitaii]|uniref:GntR family transcriptional regulator n=1 Tax=Herbiconiux liukaitaii TaxID=3342799 RepID=UPI0035B6C067